ncbi:unnamed protein product [Fusarium graminearum]|nr:unnamed protein product [Fusarium graminearum]CAG1959163.1 unnamed protein product [Fusarium graminearum]VTO91603.1 unnamed protein product [Fusarium graminearum]
MTAATPAILPNKPKFATKTSPCLTLDKGVSENAESISNPRTGKEVVNKEPDPSSVVGCETLPVVWARTT